VSALNPRIHHIHDTAQTYIFQHPHLPTHNPNLLIVLALELIQHRIRILALLVRGSRPEASVPTASPALSIRAWVSAEARVGSAQM
jgi:hypothetical protein